MKNRSIMKLRNKLIFLFFVPLVLGGCTHAQIPSNQLKSVQVFHSNSGSNYLFENSKTMEEKHGEQN